MKVIRVRLDEKPEIVDIGNTEEALREQVGGALEVTRQKDDMVVVGKAKTIGGTYIIAGLNHEGYCDVPRLDETLWDVLGYVRYTCEDKLNNVWKCIHCSHLAQFEADGPYENGWDFCPHCGGEILKPRGVQRV